MSLSPRIIHIVYRLETYIHLFSHLFSPYIIQAWSSHATRTHGPFLSKKRSILLTLTPWLSYQVGVVGIALAFVRM